MNKIEQSKRTFNDQAQTYDQDYNGRHARSLYPFMLQKIITTNAYDVLDIGCGTCALMKQVYTEDPSRHLCGIDLCENMLQIGKEVMGNHAELQLGDAHRLPYEDNCFDLVYCNDSFHHYPNPIQVIQEISRVLRPQGTLLIGDCTQSGISRIIMNIFFRFSKSGDVHMYAKQELITLLTPCFHSIRYEKVNGKSIIISGIRRL